MLQPSALFVGRVLNRFRQAVGHVRPKRDRPERQAIPRRGLSLEGQDQQLAGRASEGLHTSQDIQTLRLAQQELAQGRTLKQIAPGLPVVDASAPSTALVLSPEANLALGQALERTSTLSVSVTDHDERLADLEAFFRLSHPKMKEPR